MVSRYYCSLLHQAWISYVHMNEGSKVDVNSGALCRVVYYRPFVRRVTRPSGSNCYRLFIEIVIIDSVF